MQAFLEADVQGWRKMSLPFSVHDPDWRYMCLLFEQGDGCGD